MQNKKNMKKFIAALSLSSLIPLLSACGSIEADVFKDDNDRINNRRVTTYSIEKVKVLILEENNEILPKLVYVKQEYKEGSRKVTYFDLKKSKDIISITYKTKGTYDSYDSWEPYVTLGENYTIIEEIDFNDYLKKYDVALSNQSEFTFAEIINFYNKTLYPVIMENYKSVSENSISENSINNEISSDICLKLADLKNIEENTNGFYQNDNSKLFIKLKTGDYLEISSDYLLYSTDGETLDITNNHNIPDDELLGTVRDYIIENEIEPIGYEMADIPNINESYIIETYGESINEYLKEEGYPVVCFDVLDFYMTFEAQKEGYVIYKLEKKDANE